MVEIKGVHGLMSLYYNCQSKGEEIFCGWSLYMCFLVFTLLSLRMSQNFIFY